MLIVYIKLYFLYYRKRAKPLHPAQKIVQEYIENYGMQQFCTMFYSRSEVHASSTDCKTELQFRERTSEKILFACNIRLCEFLPGKFGS